MVENMCRTEQCLWVCWVMKRKKKKYFDMHNVCCLLGSREAFDDYNAQIIIFISHIPTKQWNIHGFQYNSITIFSRVLLRECIHNKCQRVDLIARRFFVFVFNIINDLWICVAFYHKNFRRTTKKQISIKCNAKNVLMLIRMWAISCFSDYLNVVQIKDMDSMLSNRMTTQNGNEHSKEHYRYNNNKQTISDGTYSIWSYFFSIRIFSNT